MSKPRKDAVQHAQVPSTVPGGVPSLGRPDGPCGSRDPGCRGGALGHRAVAAQLDLIRNSGLDPLSGLRDYADRARSGRAVAWSRRPRGSDNPGASRKATSASAAWASPAHRSPWAFARSAHQPGAGRWLSRRAAPLGAQARVCSQYRYRVAKGSRELAEPHECLPSRAIVPRPTRRC
jgi:hypothetical protein